MYPTLFGSTDAKPNPHLQDLAILAALITQPTAQRVAQDLIAQRRREYQTYCDIRRANGRKGGRPRGHGLPRKNHLVSQPKNHLVSGGLPRKNHLVSQPASRSLDLSTKNKRERSPRAREAPATLQPADPGNRYAIAWRGQVLTVRRYLHDDFRAQLNGQAFDLDGFYRGLDARLVANPGEQYSGAWLGQHFQRARPRVTVGTAAPPASTDRTRPISYLERKAAEQEIDRAFRRGTHCPHGGGHSHAECLAQLVRDARAIEAAILHGADEQLECTVQAG